MHCPRLNHPWQERRSGLHGPLAAGCLGKSAQTASCFELCKDLCVQLVIIVAGRVNVLFHIGMHLLELALVGLWLQRVELGGG